jgi:4-hydroxy-tetrahydrodipicolinate synthase
MNLSGVGAALVCPFGADLTIDWQGFERLLQHTDRIGINYRVVQGTTGESPTVSAEEKKALLRFAIEHNPRKLPIVYGIGGNHTAALLENIKNTDFEGVDAILSASPYYNKPSQQGIVEHYRRLADASPVPIILYNVPGRTASNLSAETTLRLAEHPNIVAVKEASGNLIQCMEIARHKPEGFALISGDDMLTNSMIAFGAIGVISVMANAFKQFNDSVHLALQGQYQEANALLLQLLEINDLMYVESNPVGVKAALQLLGVCEGHVRLPLVAASEGLSEKLRKALAALD